MASHVTGSHFNILSERSGWYILSCRGDSDLHATSSRWYTFMRPTQPVEQTDNESICVKHLCVPTPPTPPPSHPPCVRPIRASSVAPAVWVREAPCIVISIFLCWSPAEASPAALSTHANLHFCHHVWEMACWLPLFLVPKPTVASLCIFLLLLFFFFLKTERFLDSWHAREGSSEDYIG